MKKKIFFLLFSGIVSAKSFSQITDLNISGNVQLDAQYYNPDSAIGAPPVPEKVLTNGFANLILTYKSFSAGVRYESYLNPLQGFDRRYSGSGIMYRYASYTKDALDVTIGSFYDQFGNGLIFRSYEEPGLGFDNMMDGFRIKYNIGSSLFLKGFVGRQRLYFTYGPGIIRGADAEFNVSNVLTKFSEQGNNLIIGGSVVSKYQRDEDPIYKLPENVAAFAGRMNYSKGRISVGGEYAYKINDPSLVNNLIYKNGEALLVSTSYSKKGLGLTLSAKRIDNMNFRSDRSASLNDLLLNFLPPLTKQHTYSLAAIYPYATQPNGETGLQAEGFFTLKPETFLGGKYGTKVSVNFSRANSIDTVALNDERGYNSDFFAIGDEIYFQDINVEVNKKLNDRTKLVLSHVNLIYDKGVIEKPGEPKVYADISILELTYNLTRTNSIRTELQHLYTEQDKGNWAMLLAEYSIAPRWFITAFDEYNYGNDDEKKRLHYFTGGITYVKSGNRIAASYGRQREGIFCVGGVCRNVPAYNGVSLSITSSF